MEYVLPVQECFNLPLGITKVSCMAQIYNFLNTNPFVKIDFKIKTIVKIDNLKCVKEEFAP